MSFHFSLQGKGKMKTFWLFGDRESKITVPFPPKIVD